MSAWIRSLSRGDRRQVCTYTTVRPVPADHCVTAFTANHFMVHTLFEPVAVFMHLGRGQIGSLLYRDGFRSVVIGLLLTLNFLPEKAFVSRPCIVVYKIQRLISKVVSSDIVLVRLQILTEIGCPDKRARHSNVVGPVDLLLESILVVERDPLVVVPREVLDRSRLFVVYLDVRVLVEDVLHLVVCEVTAGVGADTGPGRVAKAIAWLRAVGVFQGEAAAVEAEAESDLVRRNTDAPQELGCGLNLRKVGVWLCQISTTSRNYQTLYSGAMVHCHSSRCELTLHCHDPRAREDRSSSMKVVSGMR